jgi:hypothetical protein
MAIFRSPTQASSWGLAEPKLAPFYPCLSHQASPVVVCPIDKQPSTKKKKLICGPLGVIVKPLIYSSSVGKHYLFWTC